MQDTLTILMDDSFLQDEEAAIIRAAQQDPALFKPLYLRWVHPIYQYLYFMVRCRAEAEDLTSQVFMKAYEQLPRYQHRGCFSAWLFTIARNLAHDHFRRSRRELPLEEAGDPLVHPDLLAQAIQSDELRRLDRVIQELPDDELELIRLRYAARLTYREIGAATGRSEEAARKNMTRLLARLQDQMEANHA
jgi:RNA polymerase sigma-70 factor (ECF subfamily)